MAKSTHNVDINVTGAHFVHAVHVLYIDRHRSMVMALHLPGWVHGRAEVD